MLLLPFVCPSWAVFHVDVCIALIDDTVKLLC